MLYMLASLGQKLLKQPWLWAPCGSFLLIRGPFSDVVLMECSGGGARGVTVRQGRISSKQPGLPLLGAFHKSETRMIVNSVAPKLQASKGFLAMIKASVLRSKPSSHRYTQLQHHKSPAGGWHMALQSLLTSARMGPCRGSMASLLGSKSAERRIPTRIKQASQKRTIIL